MSTTFYEVRVTKTGKAVGRKEDYSTFDIERKEFATINAVKSYLKETYGTCKREKMYIDSHDLHQPIHIGYIYSFKNEDVSHAPVNRWYQKDWIEVRELKATTIIVK